MDIQTTVKIDPNWADRFAIADAAAIVLQVAIHIDTDPVDHKRRCTIFTDDGHGNGELILRFDME
jgi:hypothetical protein